MRNFADAMGAVNRFYGEPLRVQVETPLVATEAERDWVRRRTHGLFVGDWNLLVAPRVTRILCSCQRTLSRFRAAWVVWWDPDILDEPF